MNDDIRWSSVGTTGEWADGQARVVQVGARRIAIFRTGERFRALKDACPHAGVSLAMGQIHDDQVVCPAHAWAFKLDDGRCTIGPATCAAVAYPVRVSGEVVEIGIP